jgi:integrase
MRVKIYRRHAASCRIRRADNKGCTCALWFQYSAEGKGQIKSSAKTRSLEIAEKLAQKLEAGEMGVTEKITPVEDAVKQWLKHREQKSTDQSKAKLIGAKLVAWAKREKFASLKAISKSDVAIWQTTDDWTCYASETSSSLKIHWSVLKGFFSYAVGAGMLKESPIPTGPQFRISFEAPEVKPYTAAEMKRMLDAVDHMQWDAATRFKVSTFILTMRWSAMAIRDTATLRRDAIEDTNLIKGRRSKTNERFRVRLPLNIVQRLNSLSNDRPEYFFWSKANASASTCVGSWEHILTQVFDAAKITGGKSHRFRHTFITDELAHGTPVDAVSLMVGTSPQIIRKTYQHWIKEAEDRLDQLQAASWQQRGMDANGNLTVQ